LQVASLAGVPPLVIRRAKAYLGALEAQQQTVSPQGALALMPAPEEPGNELQDTVDALDPDALSPKEALEILYALKKL
jgi:DNA mismatch repair protein MutS